MRMLAVSTDTRWPGTDAPTLMEAGYDVNVQNWRMIAAAPGLSDEQKAAEEQKALDEQKPATEEQAEQPVQAARSTVMPHS